MFQLKPNKGHKLKILQNIYVLFTTRRSYIKDT